MSTYTKELILRSAILGLILFAMLFIVCGCVMIPRLLYPIQVGELDAAAQQWPHLAHRPHPRQAGERVPLLLRRLVT